MKKFQIEAPFIISISLIGMKGAVIQGGHSWGRPFLVEEIYLPAFILPIVQGDIQLQLSEIYKHLKPSFDIIWQSVSENQSPYYTVT